MKSVHFSQKREVKLYAVVTNHGKGCPTIHGIYVSEENALARKRSGIAAGVCKEDDTFIIPTESDVFNSGDIDCY